MSGKGWTHTASRDGEVVKVVISSDNWVWRRTLTGSNALFSISVASKAMLEESGWVFEERTLTLVEQVQALPSGTRFLLTKPSGEAYVRYKRGTNYIAVSLHSSVSERVQDCTLLSDEDGPVKIEVIPVPHVHEFIGRPRRCACGEEEK